uniref:Gametocyte-specific factor 1-like n=1 Tax=Cyprinus carpio TaxID=7962 RepID=A0A8C2CB14_CYPCA
MPKKGSDSKSVLTAPRWEEVQDFCNPDKLLLCPYDPNHLIRACRFPYHLIKCRKNHPELVGELWTCPFNARHLMRKHELSHHISTCVDRCSVNDTCVASDKTDSNFQIPVSTWTAPVCDEDWDEGNTSIIVPQRYNFELVNEHNMGFFNIGLCLCLTEVDKHVTSAPSFVWDVSKSLPQDRENPSTPGNVIAGLRAPRVLPWMSSCTDF